MENEELQEAQLNLQSEANEHLDAIHALTGELVDTLGKQDDGKNDEPLAKMADFLSKAKGEKGDKGDKGDKGEDGKHGKDGIRGKDGKPGKDGKNGKDGINGINGKDGKKGKDGVDGKDGKNGKDGKDGIDGLDGSPDTGIDIVEKINKLPENEFSPKIDAIHIKNLPIKGYIGGGGGSVKWGDIKGDIFNQTDFVNLFNFIGYTEYTLDGSDNITNVDTWTDSGKGTKLTSKVITWTGSNPTQETITDELTGRVMTITMAYTGSTLDSITKTIS